MRPILVLVTSIFLCSLSGVLIRLEAAKLLQIEATISVLDSQELCRKTRPVGNSVDAYWEITTFRAKAVVREVIKSDFTVVLLRPGDNIEIMGSAKTRTPPGTVFRNTYPFKQGETVTLSLFGGARNVYSAQGYPHERCPSEMKK
jgi:hypothetical protein